MDVFVGIFHVIEDCNFSKTQGKEQRGNKLIKITLNFRLDLVGSIEQNRRRSRATLRIL